MVIPPMGMLGNSRPVGGHSLPKVYIPPRVRRTFRLHSYSLSVQFSLSTGLQLLWRVELVTLDLLLKALMQRKLYVSCSGFQKPPPNSRPSLLGHGPSGARAVSPPWYFLHLSDAVPRCTALILGACLARAWIMDWPPGPTMPGRADPGPGLTLGPCRISILQGQFHYTIFSLYQGSEQELDYLFARYPNPSCTFLFLNLCLPPHPPGMPFCPQCHTNLPTSCRI